MIHLIENRNLEANRLLVTYINNILQYISNLTNRRNIIAELSHRSFDEEFYKNLDENKNIFVCKNGVLDLVTGEFRPGKASDMSTFSCNINYPTNIETVEANNYFIEIQDYLDKIFVDKDIQEYCFNLFAECLTGQNTKEEFYILTGSGSNGKSQLLKLLNWVFGQYYHTFNNTLLNTPSEGANNASPAIAELKGRRIAITSEPNSKKPIQTDKVKELCGGDNLTGRHLHKDMITFSPQFKMFLACNDIPDMCHLLMMVFGDVLDVFLLVLNS